MAFKADELDDLSYCLVGDPSQRRLDGDYSEAWTNLLRRLVLSHQSIGRLQAHTLNGFEIVATAQDCHLTEFFVRPPGEIVFATCSELRPPYPDATSGGIEFQEDL